MNVYKFISDNIKSKIQEIDEIKSVLTADVANNIAVEVPKIRDFGDYSTNVAMMLVKLLKKSKSSRRQRWFWIRARRFYI